MLCKLACQNLWHTQKYSLPICKRLHNYVGANFCLLFFKKNFVVSFHGFLYIKI